MCLAPNANVATSVGRPENGPSNASSVEGSAVRAGATEQTASLAILAAGALSEMLGPLSYLLSNLEHIEHRLSDPERDPSEGRATELRRCVCEAVAGAKRLQDLALDVTARRSGISHVDLESVLISCLKIARTEIDHSARVITDFDAVPPIVGNESRVSRLFLNLIVNAAQAVASDAENDHFIRVVTRVDASRGVVVEISDSGPGIAREHLERVFEPFFTIKAAWQGTGLGLSVCREIAVELGATISVESTPGKGSTFSVAFPSRRGRVGDDAPSASDEPFAPAPPPVRRLPLPPAR